MSGIFLLGPKRSKGRYTGTGNTPAGGRLPPEASGHKNKHLPNQRTPYKHPTHIVINLNGTLLTQWPPDLYTAQRAMWYADTLFETIRVFEGKIPLLPHHWDRLCGGMRTLRYAVPTYWSAAFFEEEILRVAPPHARVRLTVWRSPGGWYTPTDDQPVFQITAQPLPPNGYEWLLEGLHLGLCRSVRLLADDLSAWKAPNASRYVLAAVEARDQGWDDTLLLNMDGRVCEATTSNLAWIKGRHLYTPPLTEGPVTGVIRGLLPLLTERTGLTYGESSAPVDTLLQADELLLTNAIRGIRWVRVFEGREYDCTQTSRLHQALAVHIQDLLATGQAADKV